MSKDEWTRATPSSHANVFPSAGELLPMHLCLLPSVETQAQIAEHLARWAGLSPDAVTRAWRLHLTVLAGLGGDPGTRTAPWDVLEARLLRKLEKLKFGPMQIDLAQAMVWSGHVAVLVADESAALRKLRDSLLMMAREAGLRPIKPMDTPHITLSRSATAATRAPQDFAPIRWTVSDIALVRSTPYPAWYEVVGRYGR